MKILRIINAIVFSGLAIWISCMIWKYWMCTHDIHAVGIVFYLTCCALMAKLIDLTIQGK